MYYFSIDNKGASADILQQEEIVHEAAMEPVGHDAHPTPRPDPQLPTGFASKPAEGAEIALNLHDYLSPRPLSTFYFQTVGEEHPHIPAGSILVVDRALGLDPLLCNLL